jgi:hypothetical protein
MALDLVIRNSARGDSKYIPKSEHTLMFKQSEDELVTDMRTQLVNCHAEMRKRTAEAVELYIAEHRAQVTCLEEDRQHFATALAKSINETTKLRNKIQDYGEWEYDEEYDEVDDAHDGLEQWRRTDTGYPDAVGVGDLGYGERVRKAAAPLKGPLTKIGHSLEPTDFVSAARKAAQAAAAAANEHSQNNKAYEKLSVPSCPRSGEMTNCVYSLGTATAVSGCYGDELEVKWLRELWSKTFDEFECSDMNGNRDQVRWKKV